jgi:deazaflavin-dependent oxidoreductase (nitroreductase family)
MSDWNQKIVEEFRENAGDVGGPFAGAPMVLLHTRGAKSGQERVNPLVYQPDGDDRFVIFASFGGAPKHPAWYHNLLAHPDVTIEVGTETFAARARVAEGEERERYWTKQKQDRPTFAAYEQKTTRQIPVVVLERAAVSPD